jgi:hypothetical protein
MRGMRRLRSRYGRRCGHPFVKRLMKVVQQIDEVFMTIILTRHAERLIETPAHGVANDCQESEGSNIGRSIGAPHAPDEILVSENNLCRHTLLVLAHLFEILAKNEGIQFGNGSQQLNRRIGIAGIPHILETHYAFVARVRFSFGFRHFN